VLSCAVDDKTNRKKKMGKIQNRFTGLGFIKLLINMD
jgi:hypothetical protein